MCIYIYIYICRELANQIHKFTNPPHTKNVFTHTDTETQRHTHTHTNKHVYIYIYICTYVCIYIYINVYSPNISKMSLAFILKSDLCFPMFYFCCFHVLKPGLVSSGLHGCLQSMALTLSFEHSEGSDLNLFAPNAKKWSGSLYAPTPQGGFYFDWRTAKN